MNPMAFFQLKSAWDKFRQRHPKFPKFLKAVSRQGITEGTIIKIDVTTPDGKSFQSNLKVQREDLELLAQLKQFTE